MTIFNVVPTLQHLGLEPWPDGRSILDGKRPPDQHLGMILSSLVAERDALKLQYRELQEENDQMRGVLSMTRDEQLNDLIRENRELAIKLQDYLSKLEESNRLISEYRKLLWWLVRDMGPMVQIDKKDLATIPQDAELMSWDEPMYNAVMLKATLKSVGGPTPGVTIVKATEKRKVSPQNCGCGIDSCLLEFHRADCPLRLPVPPPLTVDTVVPDGKCWLCGRAATGKKGAEPRCETHL